MLVTGNRELRALNQRFRGRNEPTDVLSFPANPVGKMGHAGDIAISAEIAAQNAKRLGHSIAKEIQILALHGILHLAGFDHERDNGRMAGIEANLRAELGLPVALIERNLGLPVRRSVSNSSNTAPKKSRGQRGKRVAR